MIQLLWTEQLVRDHQRRTLARSQMRQQLRIRQKRGR